MDVTAAVLAATVTVAALAPVARPDAMPSIRAAAATSAGQDIVPTTLRHATFSTSPKRPGALVPLYTSLAALQGLDIYTTSRAVSGGALEANPAMKPVAGKPWAATAVKAAATATSIFFIERAWKQNRKGAVILATAINMATAAVVAHNVNVSGRK